MILSPELERAHRLLAFLASGMEHPGKWDVERCGLLLDFPVARNKSPHFSLALRRRLHGSDFLEDDSSRAFLHAIKSDAFRHASYREMAGEILALSH